jgi:hypothetical protein
MIIHQKKLRAFLLVYKWKTLWEEEGPTDDDVLGWTLHEFNAYCKSMEFHDDDAEYLRPRSVVQCNHQLELEIMVVVQKPQILVVLLLLEVL